MTVIKKFKSKRDPSRKPYEVRRDDEGIIYCTCKGWKYSPQSNRGCVHTKQIAGSSK